MKVAARAPSGYFEGFQGVGFKVFASGFRAWGLRTTVSSAGYEVFFGHCPF